MLKFDSALIITHVIYRKNEPFDKLEGPYSSVEKSLLQLINNVEICQIPIAGFDNPVTYGKATKNKKIKLFSFLGYITPLKYILDIVIVSLITIKFILQERGKDKLIIGIDPLSCLPLTLLHKLFNFKLVFYSVDFNKNRFKNKFLQKLYEKADEISTVFSDQVWVICESLQKYKKNAFNVRSLYIPNSALFNKELFSKNKRFKNGKKIAWTGTLLTKKQFSLLFRVLKEIQDIKPDTEIFLAPIDNHNEFRKYLKEYNIKNGTILELHSRLEWQEFAAKCDIGIAIYDEEFGSTEFIEPLKIWDFLICGMPFIISGEPSVATPIKKAGVVYQLETKNTIPNNNTLEKFLKKENIKNLQSKCVNLAKKFDNKNQIEKAIKVFYTIQ